MLEPITLSENTTLNGRRFYIREGYCVPSVTTILGGTTDRTYLDKWNAKNPGAREEAADRGKAVHSAVENYLLHGEEPSPDSVAFPFFENAKPLLGQLTPLFVELPIFSKVNGFAGRVDCGARIDIDGVTYNLLIDWKTSSKKKYKFYDYPLQIAAYLHGFRETYPEAGFDFTHALLVVMNPAGVQVELYEPDQIEFYWSQFLERLELFKALSSIAS